MCVDVKLLFSDDIIVKCMRGSKDWFMIIYWIKVIFSRDSFLVIFVDFFFFVIDFKLKDSLLWKFVIYVLRYFIFFFLFNLLCCWEIFI